MHEFSIITLFSLLDSRAVHIFGSANPTAGEMYNLTCEVVGRGEHDIVNNYMYSWSKRQDNSIVNTHPVLAFTPQLKLSNAGRYTCQVTVNSMTYNASFNITIQSKSTS